MTDPAALQPGLQTAVQPLQRPYLPSWVDRLTDWVDRLPLPAWAFYFGLGLIAISLLTLVEWREGAYAVGTFNALHVFLVAQGVYGLALVHYLDRNALKVFDDFRPALAAEESECVRLRYELTTLPAGRAAVASILGALFALLLILLLLPAYLPITHTASTPLSIGVLSGFAIFIWWVFGTLIYHTLHQLRVVNAIYIRHTQIDLFHLEPLYAFSNFTARTGISLVILNILWLILLPQVTSNVISLLPAAVFLLAVGLAFLWPLLGIHRLLVKEQRRLLAEASQRMKDAIQELHRQVDERVFQEMDGLNKALASLEIEYQALKRIPTWPWEPGTLRGILGAMVLPVLIWLIQFVLSNYLSN